MRRPFCASHGVWKDVQAQRRALYTALYKLQYYNSSIANSKRRRCAGAHGRMMEPSPRQELQARSFPLNKFEHMYPSPVAGGRIKRAREIDADFLVTRVRVRLH